MIRYKALTADNAFDFCALLEVVGIEKFREAFDAEEINAFLEAGKSKKSIGFSVGSKIIVILVKNLPIAREAIYDFLAGCTEIYDPDTNTVTEVTAGVLRTMKIGEFTRLLKDFAKQDDLTDFFKEASALLDIVQDDSKN